MFCDATFYSCQKIAYHLFITRVYDSRYKAYYTTSFNLMKGKSTEDYSFIFQKLKEYINNYAELNEEYDINKLHYDFEIAIGTGAKKIFPNVIIKY